MKQSPLSFYECSPKEVALAIQGHNEAVERDYRLNFLAQYNANGLIQGGKKFKVIEPFEDEDKPTKKKPTKEERDATLAFIKKKVGE